MPVLPDKPFPESHLSLIHILEEAETLEAEVKATAEGLVNINTASAEELCALPGIGASRAADIVRYREQNGAFQTKEDIMKVSGIKQNAYDKLCDKITVCLLYTSER